MNAPQNFRSKAKHFDHHQKFDNETDSGYEEETSLTRRDPFHGLFGIQIQYYFIAMSVLCLPLYGWASRWWLSGTPFLIFVLLSGKIGALATSPKLLALSIININIGYALCSTSWLFYDLFLISCYPIASVLAILSSRRLQRQCRKLLRLLLRNFHFYEDKLAFFEIPALDIDDGDVPVLLVIRGFTFTLSTMTLVVHGVEVGVKLNDDLEIAIQTDRFTWKIMRDISIGDIYASLKGPFTSKSKHLDRFQDNHQAAQDLTSDHKPHTTGDLSHVETHGDYDQTAADSYQARLDVIDKSNTTHRARREVDARLTDRDQIRASIGARIFSQGAVPNPPKQQIKTSYLTSLVPNWAKRVFQKVPVLLRLFLNPVSYNHPVHFDSIVLTGSGKYLDKILEEQFFKYYPDENKEIRKLKEEVATFLTDGKFSVVLPDILGMASVPFLTQYDIITYVKAPKLLIHKSVQEDECDDVLRVVEVAELTGLAGTFTIPSFLLPNHEHLIPPPPTEIHEEDKADVKMSLLASLPGKLHPEMVDFAITMLKSSQILTLHKEAKSVSEDIHSAADFTKNIALVTKKQVKKKLIEAHVDDAWLYKLVLKAFDALRTAKGDVGYQMDLPVRLQELRPATYIRRSSTIETKNESRRNSAISDSSTGSR